MTVVHNGAYTTYGPARGQIPKFYGAEEWKTEKVTVLSGQVLKEGTILETNSVGKAIAHTGIVEKALVTFADIAGTKTVILAGLTFTSGSSGCSKEDLVTAFAGLTAGKTAAQANALNPVSGGSFTSGTLVGYDVILSSTADSVVFVSTTPNAGSTDVADTGNGSGTTIAISAFGSSKVAGILAFDVDASSADVDASAFIEADFWITWPLFSADPAVDTITLEDGTTKAVTDYYTGATTDLLKKKLFEGSKINVFTAGVSY